MMKMPITTKSAFDVIVVGGSYAGLQAALTLGRSQRDVLVIDGGQPCNRFTPHSQNFLTRDGAVPAEIASIGRAQIEKSYATVHFLDQDIVTSGSSTLTTTTDDGQKDAPEFPFSVTTQLGLAFTAKKLVFATGVVDELPTDIVGFADCWGKSIIHCPYCHGYEFRSKRTALLAPANVDMALHMLPLLRNLTPELYLLTGSNDMAAAANTQFSDEQVDKLRRNGVTIVPHKVLQVEHKEGFLTAVKLEDGSQLALDCMYAMLPTKQACTVPTDSFGCQLTGSSSSTDDDNNEEEGSAAASWPPPGFLQVNPMSQVTTVPGIFACGDATTPFRSVANAVAQGNMAGAMINMELATAEFEKGRM